MKGFLASTFHALDRIGTAALRRELMLVWTCDEEIGCMGSAAVVDHLRDRPVPHACLIGEPTGFVPMRMHPGHAHAHITVTGRAAHSSRPELGANAIVAAARVVAAVEQWGIELAAARSDIPLASPWVIVNVARIEGGTAINVVPDRAHIEVGFRPLPGMDATTLFRELEQRLASAFEPGAIRVVAHLGHVVPSLLTPANVSLISLLAPHKEDGPEAASFATDGGNLARAGMTPVVFGPGSIAVAHQADEHVALADLHRAADVLVDLIGRTCA
jgi:acetylornithine deacetylase